jgi:hypothetical protein
MRYRLAWEYNDHVKGHGDWYDNDTNLQAWVTKLNAEYPNIKHWIEQEDDNGKSLEES